MRFKRFYSDDYGMDDEEITDKIQVEDFWNTINSSKVNRNILKDEDVFIVEESDISLIVIKVPRADYKMRPSGMPLTTNHFWKNLEDTEKTEERARKD